MKMKILFVERKFQGFFSLEKVFRQIASNLPDREFETEFQQLRFPAGVWGIIRNLLSFRPESADIYHVTGDITYIGLVLPPHKTILTIPDLSILRNRTGLRRYILKKLLFDWPIRRAKYVTAISQATADHIVKEIGCHPDKIRTIGLPVDDVFAAGAKTTFNSDRPNLLQIGALWYKNLPNLIQAIAGLNCTLTIIGKLDDEIVELLEKNEIEHRNLHMLDDLAVKEQYERADIVVFCSVYEGFGLPIIEAQAMKTPVITSNIDPMKDVAGNGALLVDPNDPAQIRAAIESVIGDARLRDELIRRGSENVKRFLPETIAASYAELYSEAFKESDAS